MKFCKQFFVAMLLASMISATQAADVVVKYSGPSGQGSVIWWSPSTGMTNMVMSADGSVSLGTLNGATLGAAGKFITTPVANTVVTNGQAVTLAGVVNLLQGAGSENAETNTITLANPTAAGQWAIIYNSAAATNLIAVAKTGNFDGPALELGAGESAILFAPSATKWAGIGQ